MPEQEKSTHEIQDDCAQIAARLDGLAQELHRARVALRLPPDAGDAYEGRVPWSVELEIDAAIGLVIDEHLAAAADRLRYSARATAEQLRQRHLSQKA